MKKRQILLIYIAFGFLWILITDYLVATYAPLDLVIVIQRIKGIIYVVLIGFGIYFVLKKLEELNTTKEQEEKLSTLINSMVDFVNFKDGKGRWLEANDFALKLFRLENVDYRGKKDSELANCTEFYRKALLYCEKADEETWESGSIIRREEVITIPNGSKKYFDTIRVPLFNKDQSRKGLVVIGRDITELKQAEKNLRKKKSFQSLENLQQVLDMK